MAGLAERLWLGVLAAVLLQIGLLAVWWQGEREGSGVYYVAPPPPTATAVTPRGPVRVTPAGPAKRPPTAAERARERARGLRRAFVATVGGHSLTANYRDYLRADLRRRLLVEGVTLGRSQWLAYVDRSPRRQALVLWYYDEPADRFLAVGATHVSTGAPLRQRSAGNAEPHFLTPIGVFRDTPRFGDYMALNVPGRVFDFGRAESAAWQKGLVQRRTIQFQAHVGGEVGRAASHGCIRMDPDLNRFLHQRGVWDRLLAGHWKWSLVHDDDPAQPPALAGQYLVVGDSCLDFEACGQRYRGLLARLGHRPVGATVPGRGGPTAVARR